MRKLLAVICLLANVACQPVVVPPSITPIPTSLPSPSWKYLAGTSWSLIELLGKPKLLRSNVTLEITNDQLKGVAGCNEYWFTYSAPTPNMSASLGVSATVVDCLSEPLMKQEEVFLEQLYSLSNSFEVNEQRLTVKNSAGDILLVFTEVKP